MKRRKFLGIATAGAAGVAWSAAGRERTLSEDAILGMPRLLRFLGHDAVCRIGVTYRGMTPVESSEQALAEALLASMERVEPGTLETRLGARVQRDFDEGRILTIDGWIVSRTEARQCALHSLQAF